MKSLIVLGVLFLTAAPAWAPPIQSIIVAPDSVTVTGSRLSGISQTLTITRANLSPGQLVTCAADLSACETTINALLDNYTKGSMTIRVHVFAVNPQIIWTFGVWKAGLTPEANWWQ